MTCFILGGIRSGKSAFAENLALSYEGSYKTTSLHYIATAEVFDESLAERVERHKARRQNQGWQLHEAPLHIGATLSSLNNSDSVVLLDSLDMWVNNMLHHKQNLELATAEFLSAVACFQGQLIIVSSEVGLSLVPVGEAAQFCDSVGVLNQAVANLSDKVVLVVAGLPHVLKDSSE